MADLAREDLPVFLVFHGFAALHKDFSVLHEGQIDRTYCLGEVLVGSVRANTGGPNSIRGMRSSPRCSGRPRGAWRAPTDASFIRIGLGTLPPTMSLRQISSPATACFGTGRIERWCPELATSSQVDVPEDLLPSLGQVPDSVLVEIGDVWAFRLPFAKGMRDGFVDEVREK